MRFALLLASSLLLSACLREAPPPTSPAMTAAPPSIIAGAGVIDPCADFADGRHELRGGDDEIIATRTCANHVSVGFCDIEITRVENRVTLERCDSATRSIEMGDTFTIAAPGALIIRVGGRVRGVDYGAVDVAGAFAADGARVQAYLSGPFEPSPSDRFEIVRAASVAVKNLAERTELPTGGSFKIEATESALVLTDYRAPENGFHYAPVRAEPFPPGGGQLGGSLKIEGSVTTH